MKRYRNGTLRERAADMLDLTYAHNTRGPRTLIARQRIADWLDGQGGSQVKADIAWLARVAKNTPRIKS